jgi:hypothetical protein
MAKLPILALGDSVRESLYTATSVMVEISLTVHRGVS